MPRPSHPPSFDHANNIHVMITNYGRHFFPCLIGPNTVFYTAAPSVVSIYSLPVACRHTQEITHGFKSFNL
jgi:hypothetical protein